MKTITDFCFERCRDYMYSFVRHYLSDDEYIENTNYEKTKELTILRNITDMIEVFRNFNLSFWSVVLDVHGRERYNDLRRKFKNAKLVESKRTSSKK